MTDLQIIAWLFFVLLSGLVGFMIGIIFESDRANRITVEEFLEYDKKKKQTQSSPDKITNEIKFTGLSSLDGQGECENWL